MFLFGGRVMVSKFYGRDSELQLLERLSNKGSSSMVVVRGRRRIGKSRLIEEYAKSHTFYEITGLPPTKKTTAQSQRDEFARQLSAQTGIPEVKADDWSKLFILLAEKLAKGNIVLLFDEISWMGSKDDQFLGKIKHAWDLYFKKNPKLLFVLCGSAASWIDKNILSNTGFMGRVSQVISLNELSLQNCKYFWGKSGKNISNFDKLKILSVTGGVPRYLEEINPHISAEENIKNLCFTKGAVLVEEFNQIFSDLFLRNSNFYKNIVTILAQGPKEFKDICKSLNLAPSGRVSEYLDELILSGFVRREYTWHIASGLESRLSHYRLSDNYIRFYLKYIDKNKTKIDNDHFAFQSLSALPAWQSILGLQFENLVLNNRHMLHKLLGINAQDIISANPFFQRKNLSKAGCQIDYLIQTRFNNLIICEIKFSKNVIGESIMKEVQLKVDNMVRPKGYSCRAVLIHVNGVSDEVVEAQYFSNIIDFGQLLN